MTGSFVQMEVSCSIGQLYAEKMRIDRHLSVLLVFQGLAVERLAQFPSFPSKQLSQDFLAFTHAQPLQELVLLHLQHATFTAKLNS